MCDFIFYSIKILTIQLDIISPNHRDVMYNKQGTTVKSLPASYQYDWSGSFSSNSHYQIIKFYPASKAFENDEFSDTL